MTLYHVSFDTMRKVLYQPKQAEADSFLCAVARSRRGVQSVVRRPRRPYMFPAAVRSAWPIVRVDVGAKYTKTWLPVTLVYTEEFEHIDETFHCEASTGLEQ